MTWFFDRGSERLILQVAREAATYELYVHHANGSRTLEFAGSAEHLVEQLHGLAQALVAAGWRPRPKKTRGVEHGY
jgi:hypothetical protein